MVRIAVALGSGPGSETSRCVALRAAQLCAQDKEWIFALGRWSVFSPEGFAFTEAAFMHGVIRQVKSAATVVIGDTSRDTASNMVEALSLFGQLGFYRAQVMLVVVARNWRRSRFLAQKVWGSGYIITVSRVACRQGPWWRWTGKQLQEWVGYAMTRTFLIGVKAGDVAAIERRLRLWHPGYRCSSGVPQPIKLT